MTDPLRRLQYQPWRALLQVSTLTLALVAIVEFLLSIGYTHFRVIHRMLSLLYAPPLDIVLFFATAVGVGALAVYLLDRFFPQVFINTASLWALVPCLVLFLVLKSLLLKSLLLSPLFLLEGRDFGLVGIVIGVFWKGRPYWR